MRLKAKESPVRGLVQIWKFLPESRCWVYHTAIEKENAVTFAKELLKLAEEEI